MKFGNSPANTFLEDPASREEGSARNTVEKNQDCCSGCRCRYFDSNLQLVPAVVSLFQDVQIFHRQASSDFQRIHRIRVVQWEGDQVALLCQLVENKFLISLVVDVENVGMFLCQIGRNLGQNLVASRIRRMGVDVLNDLVV